MNMGLYINRIKISAMTGHREGKVHIQNEEIENVKKFKFLGSYITSEGDSSHSTTEVRIRLGQARSGTSKLTNIWKAQDLSMKFKVKLAKALVWSLALYGCESWTLRKTEEG